RLLMCITLTPTSSSVFFFLHPSGDHRDLHSFPTRRSSDLLLQKATPRMPPNRSCSCTDTASSSVRDRIGATTVRACLAALRRKTDRKSTRLNSSHLGISYAVFCLKKKKKKKKKQH